MLAKLWKKILLAVCIIACIFNVMTKLVNRTSLEANLKSVDDGTVVFNLFEKKENDSNNTVHSYTKKDANSESTNTETPEVVNEQENNSIESEETEKQNNKDSREYKYTDFIIEF